MIKIISPQRGLNPYTYENRQIRYIKIYSKTGEILASTRWFDLVFIRDTIMYTNNNTVKQFELPTDTIYKKRKFKANDKVFIISVIQYDIKYWDLYIPAEMVSYNEGKITLTGAYATPYINEFGQMDYRDEHDTKTFPLFKQKDQNDKTIIAL